MVNEEKVQRAKEGVWNYLKTGTPLTLGEIMSGRYPITIHGKTYHSKLPFEKMSGEVASLVVQRLRNEGMVFPRKRDGIGPEEYVPVTRLSYEIKVSVHNNVQKIKDAMVSIYKKGGWVETQLAEKERRYPPHHFSSYLGFHTLKREEKTKKRPSGWVLETADPWERVDATSSTLKGDVELEVSIENARFPKHDSEYDEFGLKGMFKREKGKAPRVSGVQAEHRYLNKIYRDWQEIASRTQTLDAYARLISMRTGGDESRKDEILYAIMRYPETPDENLQEMVEPMGKYFSNIKGTQKQIHQKRHEFLTYMDRRIKEESEKARLPGESR